jgi:hypothetical protein
VCRFEITRSSDASMIPRTIHFLEPARLPADETGLGPDTEVLAWDLPDFAALVTEIAVIRTCVVADNAAGRPADRGADGDGARTAAGRGSDQGADARAYARPNEGIALLVGQRAAARKQYCREKDNNKRPHTAPQTPATPTPICDPLLR